MRVLIQPEAQEQIDNLPRAIRARVYGVVRRLTEWPAVSGAKPLRGSLAGRYRVRTGDYRIQFVIRESAVFIEKVGHRDGFYEE